jgi:hypothetical protein
LGLENTDHISNFSVEERFLATKEVFLTMDEISRFFFSQQSEKRDLCFLAEYEAPRKKEQNFSII